MAATDDELFARRAALLEINGRRVNEAIDRGDGGGRVSYVCECGHLGCTRTVELTRERYEAVRRSFDRFVVVPGHEIEGVDELVERCDDHLVVAKHGAGAEMARETDPRDDG